MVEKERFFVCPECFDLITWTKIMEECSNGGPGLCDCKYKTYEWSEEYDDYEPIFWREYSEYLEISEKLYNALKKIKQVSRILRCSLPQSEIIKTKYNDNLKGIIEEV